MTSLPEGGRYGSDPVAIMWQKMGLVLEYWSTSSEIWKSRIRDEAPLHPLDYYRIKPNDQPDS